MLYAKAKQCVIILIIIFSDYEKESKMAEVFRIFVEKKKGNDIEARHILDDLKTNVGITALEDLRLINRYDAQGLSR